MKARAARVPIPDRLRGAGLLMIVGTLPWALMPVGVALGADLSKGIGVTFTGGGQVAVTIAMLPWLAPLSAATTVTGLLVYYGRATLMAIALSVIWVGIGLAAAPQIVIIAGLVCYCVATGRSRLDQDGEPPTLGG